MKNINLFRIQCKSGREDGGDCHRGMIILGTSTVEFSENIKTWNRYFKNFSSMKCTKLSEGFYFIRICLNDLVEYDDLKKQMIRLHLCKEEDFPDSGVGIKAYEHGDETLKKRVDVHLFQMKLLSVINNVEVVSKPKMALKKIEFLWENLSPEKKELYQKEVLKIDVRK